MENNNTKIATVVLKEDIDSFLLKLKKNGFLIYENIVVDGSIIIEYNPTFIHENRRYDMTAYDYNDKLLKELEKSKIKILTNIEFQESFIKTKTILIALSTNEKEEIQQKANELNLAISDLLYFVGTNIKGLEKSDTAIANRKKDSKGSEKTTISLRANTRDKELFLNKANQYGMNLSEFFIISALNFDIKLLFKK